MNLSDLVKAQQNVLGARVGGPVYDSLLSEPNTLEAAHNGFCAVCERLSQLNGLLSDIAAKLVGETPDGPSDNAKAVPQPPGIVGWLNEDVTNLHALLSIAESHANRIRGAL